MFARTERLLLRPGFPEDAQALALAIGDPAVSRNLARVPYPYGIADAHAFLSQPHDILLPRVLMFSRTLGAPRLVGGCGIDRRADGALELGYWLGRHYWGLGFATEAAGAVMDMARASGLSDIQAAHAIDNPASGKVLRKLGFQTSGRIENRYSVARGTDMPCLMYEQGSMVAPADNLADDIYADSTPLAA